MSVSTLTDPIGQDLAFGYDALNRVLNDSAVVMCHAETPMLPLDHAESADQDKGVCDGMADGCPGSHRHCARRGIARSV